MHKCVYSLLHSSRPLSVSHMPRYIRHPAGPTSDVTNCIHICDRGACVAYISIYIIYIIYVPIHRSHYIQHYTNRFKYSASNIPTFSRRESNLLPSTPPTPSPSNTPLKFIIHLLLYYNLTPILRIYITRLHAFYSYEIISLQEFLFHLLFPPRDEVYIMPFS